MKLLITGGTGYIGSHTCLSLLTAGHEVVILDNLSNSSIEVVNRLTHLAGRAPVFVEGDIRDYALLIRLLTLYKPQAVLHFAGLKSVNQSFVDPLGYYDNNVLGSQTLLKAMFEAKIFSFVFSSSATVYGEPNEIPILEITPVNQPLNPYGRSKLIVEDILRDLSVSDDRWRIAILRYFNPVGAHESGLIGEDAKSIPTNLVPYICQVALGRLPELLVFGNDYPTPDGTGIRDYIHVLDLAEGHLRALEALKTQTGSNLWNLGTGRGYSVLEISNAFQTASNRIVPYRIVPRRPGDVASCYANPRKAEKDLMWKAHRGLNEMMRDVWNWQVQNPNGY